MESAMHGSVANGGYVGLNQTEQDIVDVYKSLCTLARSCIRDVGDEVRYITVPVDEQAEDLTRLMNELVYIKWVLSLSRGTTDENPFLLTVASVGQSVSNALLSCLEKEDQRQPLLCGLCAIRRYHIVEDVTATSGNGSVGAEENLRAENRIKQLMVRSGITADDVESSLSIVYKPGRYMGLAFAPMRGDLRGDVVTVHTYTDGKIAESVSEIFSSCTRTTCTVRGGTMTFMNTSSSFHLHLDASTQHGVQSSSAKCVPQFSRASNITYKGERCPVVYVTHKIVRILAQHNRALHTLEVEKALRSLGFMGVDICTNKELFESLQKVKRIEFDIVRKRLLYKNPYESVTSADALVDYVNKHYVVKGLRVNEELLNTNPKMVEWIDDVLRHRKLRAVRSTISNVKGKRKCRYAGKSNQCTLYSSAKCGECANNVRDVLLFPLGKENFEQDRFKLDHDIKDLWDAVAMPPLDQLLKEYNVSQVEHTYVAPQRSRRRGREPKQSNSGVKMRRIYNTHLFTAQELSADICKTLRK
ncbi:uncharacterized protein BXIN_1551 [Babesia sp. Xinjiang]|uniref:uncharacterized protein n=1 Tax=Babesia sp. Xinjiang TaxID=462227 RepID=UPI000A224603|nr:uncharacterized protein BXIN_1551 [Babesia sp. Xinjiang]ORM42315.1 hypothetical protein BXIN_1551 [Babesia sp. Xinjiang]